MPKSICVECEKVFDPLIERSVLANRCNACAAPKRPDPRLVAKAQREDEIAAAEGQVYEEVMNNDPHEIRIAKNRLDKIKAKSNF